MDTPNPHSISHCVEAWLVPLKTLKNEMRGVMQAARFQKLCQTCLINFSTTHSSSTLPLFRPFPPLTLPLHYHYSAPHHLSNDHNLLCLCSKIHIFIHIKSQNLTFRLDFRLLTLKILTLYGGKPPKRSGFSIITTFHSLWHDFYPFSISFHSFSLIFIDFP